jgi:DNA-binding IclR family transcriptional regulator
VEEHGVWTEHPATRVRARVRVLHVIESGAQDGYTAEALSKSLGLPLFEVRGALTELTADGLVVRVEDEYASLLQFD